MYGYICGSPESPYCVGGCDFINCFTSPPVCFPFEVCFDSETEYGGSGWNPWGGGGIGGSGGGGSGGGSTPPTCPEEPTGRTSIQEECGPAWTAITLGLIINDLSNTMSLTSGQVSWLFQNPDKAIGLINYFALSGLPQAEKIEIAKEHLSEMMNNGEYLAFVEDYTNQTASELMWWENTSWLDNVNNINLDIDGNPPQKLNAAEKLWRFYIRFRHTLCIRIKT